MSLLSLLAVDKEISLPEQVDPLEAILDGEAKTTKYPEEVKQLWQTYFPKSGQADTVQGELFSTVFFGSRHLNCLPTQAQPARSLLLSRRTPSYSTRGPEVEPAGGGHGAA